MRKQKKDYVEVAAALIRHEEDGRFLITQRHLDDFLGGLWEFPGGKRRKNETLERCLKREIKEEVGVDIEVGARHKAVSYEYPDRAVSILFYWARINKGRPQTLGCRNLKWVHPHELLDYNFPPADAELILELSRPEKLFCN
ncbi:MAG: 8-oxo-dGTP diphosphatase MutT [Candidatus Omnitrophica bacterium]|nr:8-oxo-dGTP diphosphatase MutT [Candidatus Omnitrophota bacterium]